MLYCILIIHTNLYSRERMDRDHGALRDFEKKKLIAYLVLPMRWSFY
jgi:hypothetical protein